LGSDFTIGTCLANSCLDKCHESDEQDFAETGILARADSLNDKVSTAKPSPAEDETGVATRGIAAPNPEFKD
jgi:hypothetical protein